jgi:serine/threonine protein kinase/Tfp pilus assembly protein PilF
VATPQDKRTCSVCGTLLADDSEYCAVCAFHAALETQSYPVSDPSSELRFEHYEVLRSEDGRWLELGHGGMGVTYKAIDIHLRCSVALKIISAQFIGNEAARSRFVREARAAASVHHTNVATVFHLGESGGNYFYAMEFVDGETLATLIRRHGRLEVELALGIMMQTAAGLTAIHKQRLVHRDIKPSNIMLTWEEGRLEHVKIIDLGLAKGATEDTLSIAGSFIGTPVYASPEQLAGLGADIRSDLYSLGVTLWEMLSGKPPFYGSATELMDQHQHVAPPFEKLMGIPEPILALLEVLLAKDPQQRFQTAARMQQALTKTQGAIASRLRLTADDLRTVSSEVTPNALRAKPSKRIVRWPLAIGLGLAAVITAWFFLFGHAGSLFKQGVPEGAPVEKSIAVLPFDSLSETKSDTYFADGVQDEILNNLAKVAQLKVISRTSVMQYRGESKSDLRQIANTLNVANVLEGTVRRNGNRVRVSTELVDARNDQTIWADSYDRDLTDIFAIQSEIAQKVASKLAAALSPDEKNRIEAKPTDNLQAYDLYLRANELIRNVHSVRSGDVGASMSEALPFLEKAVQLDPKFTLAYCAIADVHDLVYHFDDPTPERRTLGDAAIVSALRLEPDLPEVHLAYAQHLYVVYRDYEGARAQLAVAKRGSPNNSEANTLEALIDLRQGTWGKSIQEFREAIKRDPSNTILMAQFSGALSDTRQFAAAERAYDRLIELVPDQPKLKILKAYQVGFKKGDDMPLRSAIAAIPASMTDDDVLCWGLKLSLCDHDWQRARELIEKMKGPEDPGYFAWGDISVPIGCYSILLARLQGKQLDENPGFTQTRAALNQKVQRSPEGASLLSQLAVVDALLNEKETAITEAKRAVELLPVSKDAVSGPTVLINLAVVYAWTNEVDLAFQTLASLTKVPAGISFGELKLEPYFDPLRNDPRFNKLLVESVPRDSGA